MSKPSIPQGTRDFSPSVMARRNFILETISGIYKNYGFMPLETPAMENLSTLTGKYGNEGDQLIFKILNNGDFMKEIDPLAIDSKTVLPKIAEKGLRYDLTVPLARFVVMNRNDISFPFKRYQMQAVWRADRPQKGRYREFWQCDADVLGTDSLLCEADFLRIYQSVFEALGLKGYEVRINHRKMLEAACEMAGSGDKFKSITVIIDKLDKIGTDGVSKELMELGLNSEQSSILLSFLVKMPLNQTTIQQLRNSSADNEKAKIALDELEQVIELSGSAIENVTLDLSLARGLDYYTGCIFEAVSTDVKMGSISGGGRYDDLTGVFGLKDVSGIGISFGIDRIYDVLNELNLFPPNTFKFTEVLFCPFDEESLKYCIPLADELRQAGIKTEIYPKPVKIKKQLDYANSKQIQWAIIVGEDERKAEKVVIKNLVDGNQQTIDKQLIKNFKH
ncbi:MAG TPA: histidine--tRNA ligase [Bacteroidia bacterium]